jgi:hypothetical protein
VTSSAGKTATCVRLDASSGHVAMGCSCGCAECLAVCDGKGPVFAGLIPPTPDAPSILHVDLPKLPSKGRLGLYVRVRGEAPNPIPIIIIHGAAPVGAIPLNIGSSTSFLDITTGGSESGASGPEWNSADAAPTAIEIKPQGNKFGIEIDCIVPFVIP